MPFFFRDGIQFHYRETGKGIPFFFQHGLGGDVNQPFRLFKPPDGFRLLAFDCRAHGETRPVGDPEKISLATFADDLLALMAYLEIERAVIGGISMGAAVALNFALRFPERIRGLILQRPAWLAEPMAENAKIYDTIARLIREHGPEEGRKIFMGSDIYEKMLAASSDCAGSLLGQFTQARAAETVIRLERIPRDAPNRRREEWQQIRVKTLILANRQDPIHPFEYGQILAQEIAGARFEEITPKSVSVERYGADSQRLISEFLPII